MNHARSSGSSVRGPMRQRATRSLLAGAGMALILLACQNTRGPGIGAPTPLTAAARAVAGEHFRIDADASQVLVLVYRDGSLASLGHNHVIALHELRGELTLAADPAQSQFSVSFPVASMSVDDAALRAGQGADFQTPINAASIQGTRDHMLGATLLDGMHFPTIELRSQQLRADSDGLIASTLMQVREHSGLVDVPIRFERDGEQLTASGEFDLTHAELGLTPYSVALGALRVAERMHVRYRLVARREPG